MLQHARVVGHGAQMSGIQIRQMFYRVDQVSSQVSAASSGWAGLGCNERSNRAR